MKQDVAHLFDNLIVVPFLNRLDQLVALFEKEMLERVESLLPIPRATAGAEQGRDDLPQAVESGGEVVGGGQGFCLLMHAYAAPPPPDDEDVVAGDGIGAVTRRLCTGFL